MCHWAPPHYVVSFSSLCPSPCKASTSFIYHLQTSVATVMSAAKALVWTLTFASTHLLAVQLPGPVSYTSELALTSSRLCQHLSILLVVHTHPGIHSFQGKLSSCPTQLLSGGCSRSTSPHLSPPGGHLIPLHHGPCFTPLNWLHSLSPQHLSQFEMFSLPYLCTELTCTHPWTPSWLVFPSAWLSLLANELA